MKRLDRGCKLLATRMTNTPKKKRKGRAKAVKNQPDDSATSADFVEEEPEDLSKLDVVAEMEEKLRILSEKVKKLEIVRIEQAVVSLELQKRVDELEMENRQMEEKLGELDSRLSTLQKEQQNEKKTKVSLQKDVKQLQNRSIKDEFIKRGNCLIIRGMKTEKEDSAEKLREKVNVVFQQIGAKEGCLSARRLVNDKKSKAMYVNAATGKTFHPLIHVELKSIDEKKEIFSLLKNLPREQRMRITPDYPKAIRPRIQELESLAFKLRKEKGLITRVRVRNSVPVLLTRSKDKSVFELYKEK